MSTVANQNPKTSLFIGDLSIFCTEKDLQDMFQPFGELVEIKIMKSEDKGRSLSYGFVKFADPAAAERAMRELHSHLFHGRKLR
jgi:RNA-binding protein 39